MFYLSRCLWFLGLANASFTTVPNAGRYRSYIQIVETTIKYIFNIEHITSLNAQCMTL